METGELTPSAEHTDKHAAFISYCSMDREWARRLQSDLANRGVEGVVADFTLLEVGDTWNSKLREALGNAEALIVLWSPNAVGSTEMQREISTFDLLARTARLSGGPPKRIIPIFFGEAALTEAPRELQDQQGFLLDGTVYEVGPTAKVPRWKRVMDQLAQTLIDDGPEKTPSGAEQVRAGPESAPEPVRPVKSTLELLRAWVFQGGQQQPGWVLDGNLVVALASELDRDEKTLVRTRLGDTEGTPERWPQSHANLHEPLLPIRIALQPEQIGPLPMGPVAPGRNVEIWGWALARPDARGRVGELRPDGSYNLAIESGNMETGAGAWDIEAACFIGVALPAASGWRLVPTTTLIDLAGRSRRSQSALPPSAHIHDDGWTVEDRLDYALYGRAIKEFVLHPNTHPPLAIGIQGPWGQGKTSLMRIAQKHLDPGHPDLQGTQPTEPTSEGKSQVTFRDLRAYLSGSIDVDLDRPPQTRSVWFNAWKYQSSEALWAGLAHTILTQLPARLPRRSRELFWLRLQLRRIDGAKVRQDIHRAAVEWFLPRLVLWTMLSVALAIALAIVGVPAIASALGGCAFTVLLSVFSWSRALKKSLERKLEGSYLRYVSQPDYEAKMGYLHEVEEDMRRAFSLLTPADAPTVVFIDDLDRCSPDRISEILEAINLFLSGEYPECVFVLGIDAKVVATAMELVHKDLLDESERGKGKLGWQFMDKFIQLSFPMPRPSNRQKEAYLDSLLGVAQSDRDETRTKEIATQAGQVDRELRDGTLQPDEAAALVGKLAGDPAAGGSAAARNAAESVIETGAQGFSDSSEETVEALRSQLPHLSDNPRTIKRAINLYRFYRFISWAREASSPDLESADPTLIARWAVLAARWPQFVQWLQVNGRDSDDPLSLVEDDWRGKEPELCEFLATGERLDLKRAMACGLW